MIYSLPAQISEEIFRAYDVRGIVGKTLTTETVYAIGLALGSLAKERGQDRIVLGHDHRESSPAFFKALVQALRETGMHVISVGQVPTPLLYFACFYLKVYTGVMITGSHCGPEYNGLKMMLAGDTLSDDAIQNLLLRIKDKRFTFAETLGDYREEDVSSAYLEKIISSVGRPLRSLKVVLDAGHGMMSELGPALIKKMGCELVPLYCNIDSRFPDHHPDPSVPENLQDLIRAVKQEKADVGIAFDGDGDRIGVVTSAGKIIWPDRLLAAFSKFLLPTYPNGKIIFDVKCSRHLAKLIHEFGGEPILWKTGHSHIKTKMKEEQAILAGEMSGHIFFLKDWYGFDDALFAAGLLVNILSRQNTPSDAYFLAIPDSVNTPELKLPMPEDKKFTFMKQFSQQAHFPGAKVITIDGIRVEYEDGFGLIRASNTSPCLVLRFEGETDGALRRIQEAFRGALLKQESGLQLPF